MSGAVTKRFIRRQHQSQLVAYSKNRYRLNGYIPVDNSKLVSGISWEKADRNPSLLVHNMSNNCANVQEWKRSIPVLSTNAYKRGVTNLTGYDDSDTNIKKKIVTFVSLSIRFVYTINSTSLFIPLATGYCLDGPGIEFRWGKVFWHPSRPVLWPTQPPAK